MKGIPIRWTEAELAWIEARRETPRRELHALFLETFGRDEGEVSRTALTQLCKRKGWGTGRDGRFAGGHVPSNKGKTMPFNANSARTRFRKGERKGRANARYRPIGTERISKDGYLERKIHDGLPLQSRWRAVHLIRWEELHGPVRPGEALKCLDGDRTNTDPSNWHPVPRGLLPRLNSRFGRGYDDAPLELKPTIMAIAKLEHEARQRRARRETKDG